MNATGVTDADGTRVTSDQVRAELLRWSIGGADARTANAAGRLHPDQRRVAEQALGGNRRLLGGLVGGVLGCGAVTLAVTAAAHGPVSAVGLVVLCVAVPIALVLVPVAVVTGRRRPLRVQVRRVRLGAGRTFDSPGGAVVPGVTFRAGVPDARWFGLPVVAYVVPLPGLTAPLLVGLDLPPDDRAPDGCVPDSCVPDGRVPNDRAPDDRAPDGAGQAYPFAPAGPGCPPVTATTVPPSVDAGSGRSQVCVEEPAWGSPPTSPPARVRPGSTVRPGSMVRPDTARSDMVRSDTVRSETVRPVMVRPDVTVRADRLASRELWRVLGYGGTAAGLAALGAPYPPVLLFALVPALVAAGYAVRLRAAVVESRLTYRVASSPAGDRLVISGPRGTEVLPLDELRLVEQVDDARRQDEPASVRLHLERRRVDLRGRAGLAVCHEVTMRRPDVPRSTFRSSAEG